MPARAGLLAEVWHRNYSSMTDRPIHRPRARAAALLVSLAVASSAAAAEVNVSVRRAGEALVIDANATLDADPATAWRVLTDYERYVDFVPGMRSSRVVERRGDNVTVAQSADSPAWLMRMPFDVVYAITERPPDRIESSARGSMLAGLDSQYRLTPSASGVRLDYVGRLTPRSALFGGFEELAVRQGIVREFEALAHEIERVHVAGEAGQSTAQSMPGSPPAR